MALATGVTVGAHSFAIMNKKSLAECVGEVVKLRPNPIQRSTSKPIKEDLNSWTFIAFPNRKTLVLQHLSHDFRVEIPAVKMHGHEPPNLLSMRGKVFIEDDSTCVFEPFIEGMIDATELVDDPMNRQSQRIYDTLKSHEGKLVTVRFPSDTDVIHYPTEATLTEVTPHFAKLFVEEIRIVRPDWFGGDRKDFVAQEAHTKTVALSFIKYEEDDAHENRPRLVIEYHHWNLGSQ